MDGISIEFEGVNELYARFADLAGPEVEKMARHAIREGAHVIQAAITEAAPVRDPTKPSTTALPPGALKNDIVVSTLKEPDGSITALIQPGSKTRHVAVLVEYGHEMVRGGRSRRKGGILGLSRVGPGTVTGQVPAHPFIRPAFEQSQGAAQDAIAQDIALQFSGSLDRAIGATQIGREEA